MKKIILGLLVLTSIVANSQNKSEKQTKMDQQTANVKPVLCVVTSNNVKGKTGIQTGFWLSELTHALEQLDKAGLKYELASIKGGEAPIDNMSMNLKDTVNAHYWNNDKFRAALKNTKNIDQVDASKYSAVFYAGGHGTMWDFADSKGVQKVTSKIYETGGIVSAVCHGPAALVNVKLNDGSYLVAGKKVAAFTNGEEEESQSTKIVPYLLETALINHGALHQVAPNWTKNVVVDGRLITGQNPASAAGVGEAVAKALTAGNVSSKKRIILNITCDLNKVPNIDELLPKEFARGVELQEQGIMEHLFVKAGRMGAVLVFNNVDEAQARQIATTFPLYKYFQVEYITVDKFY